MKRLYVPIIAVILILLGCGKKPSWQKWLDYYFAEWEMTVDQIQTNLDNNLPITDLTNRIYTLDEEFKAKTQEVYQSGEDSYEAFMQYYYEHVNE